MSRAPRYALKALAFVAAVEAIFFAYGLLSMYVGNPYRLYSRRKLESEIAANVWAEKKAPAAGWFNPPTATNPAAKRTPCASAWGSSFTEGAEVKPDQNWPYLLSLDLGCPVENMGSAAFGLDQTEVVFHEHHPKDSIAIVAIVWPMLQLDARSSWTFFDLDEHSQPSARMTKPFFEMEGGSLRLRNRPPSDVASIEHYYDLDEARPDWTPFSFPYTLSVIRAIRRSRDFRPLNDVGPLSGDPRGAQLKTLGALILNRMIEEATAAHTRFVLLLIPSEESNFDATGEFAGLTKQLKRGVCLIDPTKALRQAAAGNPLNLMAPHGHYNALGNAVLAKETFAGLKSCGLVS